MRHLPRRFLPLVLPSLLCCAPEAGPPGAGREPPPVLVQVVTVAPTELPRTLTAVGSLQSPETATVAADISGIVVSHDAPEGRRVRQGHVLVRIEDSVARAGLTVAAARERNARSERDRLRALVEDEVIPRQAYDDAVAELETAEGLLEEARTYLEKTEVKAPFTGVLGLRQVQVGQYLSSGDPIVQITKLHPLELFFSVPEADADRVAVGLPIEGRVGRCGEAFRGEIAVLDPTIDTDTRTLRAKAIIPNRDGKLRPGSSARLRIIVDHVADAIVVPREALIRRGTQYLVYVVDESSQVSPHNVTPGEFLVEEVELLSGLSAGETLVVAGHQKLRPGSKVQPTPWERIPNPSLLLGQSSEDCL